MTARPRSGEVAGARSATHVESAAKPPGGSPQERATDKDVPLEPAAGRFEGQAFVFPVRVYYEDTDFSGVVYHASYLRFMERGRSEFLRAAGTPHQAMLEGELPLFWAVRRMSVEFNRPARVDEALHVRTKPLELAGARLRLDQAVLRASDILVKAEVEVCIVTAEGKPRRVPEMVREKLQRFV